MLIGCWLVLAIPLRLFFVLWPIDVCRLVYLFPVAATCTVVPLIPAVFWDKVISIHATSLYQCIHLALPYAVERHACCPVYGTFLRCRRESGVGAAVV